MAGVNGLIIGNYLTALDGKREQDLQILDDLAMPVRARGRPGGGLLRWLRPARR